MFSTHIFLIYGANSDKLSNSDKSFHEHCLYFNTSHSTVLSLMISDISRNSLQIFHLVSCSESRPSLGIQGEHCVRRISIPLHLNLIFPSEIFIFWSVRYL